jgi:hypothetical protein
MLDIISMTILLFLLIGLPLILIIIGGNKDKTKEEEEFELEEERQYLINYSRKKEKYSWEQVIAYSVIALNNLKHSANDINLKNIEMIIEPLDKIHTKKTVVEYAKKLIDDETN